MLSPNSDNTRSTGPAQYDFRSLFGGADDGDGTITIIGAIPFNHF
jgi:hypothetical protein